MCNLYTLHKGPEAIRAIFAERQLPLRFPEGIPNLEPRDVGITDPAPIVRASAAGPGANELVVRRWSWPGPRGPVYNFRSNGREFPTDRCLVIADGFYEFTAPADPKAKRKDRWMFSDPDGGLIAIAGITRVDPRVGEAFTLLTTQPGPDVAPIHNRQVAIVRPADWSAWLNYEAPARDLLGPSPQGALALRAAPREESA